MTNGKSQGHRTVPGRSSSRTIFIQRQMTVRASIVQLTIIDRSSYDVLRLHTGYRWPISSFVNTCRPAPSDDRPRPLADQKLLWSPIDLSIFFLRCSDVAEIVRCPDIVRRPEGMGRFYLFFSGCPAGVRWAEDKAAGHFICTRLHRRATPLCPGIARSRETGRYRGKAG